MSKKSILSVIHAVTHSGHAATSAVEGLTAASHVSHAVNTGSSYVAPTPTYSSASPSYSGSSAAAAAAQAAEAARAAQKAAKAVVSEYGGKTKNPTSVTGKYIAASDRAKKDRDRSEKKVARVAATIKSHAPKNTENLRPRVAAKPKPAKIAQLAYPKSGPTGAYEGTAAVNQVLRMVKAKKPTTPSPSPSKPLRTPTTGPKPRKVATRLQKAVKQAKPEFAGLDSEQSKVLRTVLNQGVKAGAGHKTLLSAVETGLVESGLRNLDSGDADSQGWRQERSMYYPNPTNVKASAKRYFDEAAAAKTSGMTPGELAQAAQQSAFPERYDQMAGQAKPLLKDFTSTRKQAVPKGLKQAAKQTLGKKPTQAILKGGKVVKDPKAGKGTGPVDVSSAKEEIKAGAIQKPSKKEDKFFSYDHSTDRAWFDPILQKQLIALAKASGEPIQLNSGFRTLAEQKAAYADYQAGGNLAATPGSSNHEFGLAADVALTDTQRSMLGKFGLGLPVGGEDWHVEVVDPKLMAQQKAVNLGTAGGSATVTGGDPNIPIQGTKLAVKLPTPTGTGTTTTGTTTSGGTTTFSGSIPGAPGTSGAPGSPAQKRKQVNVSKRLAAIDRWLTSPVTAKTPDISQELIDRILAS